MQRANILPAILAFGLVSGTTSAFAADSPYLIDKRTFKKTVKTLALAPAEANRLLGMPDAVGRMLEEEVADRLDRKGFELLPVQHYRAIRERMEQQVGGYLIAGSDERDEDKVTAVREHAFREMLYRHDMDAIVTIEVRYVGAPFENNKAEWDGVEQKISRKTDGIGSLFGDEKYSGTVGVSSLQISIVDRSDKLLFSHRSGIEVAMQLDGNILAALPPERLFLDEKRLKKSVQLALKGL